MPKPASRSRRFGRAGRIDLHEGLGRPPELQSVRLTTPGVIYRDLLIIGGRVNEGLPASPGDIRAIDVRTGATRWTFRTIPAAGEAGAETWPAGARDAGGGANNWAGMAVDTARGIVFVPTGSAAADFYGADRPGDNLYANTLLALDAATGKRLWHFQTVHHDIWDRDLPAPPALVTVTHDGRRVDAVAQTSKQGIVWLFERTTGTPLFPIEERPYPASAVDGERASRTQPQPVKPAPFARQRLTEDMLTRRTPAAHAAVLEAFRRFRSDGQFVPLDVGVETVVFPGFDGGGGWGGPAFDPATGLLYVSATEMACTGMLAPAVTGSSGRQLYVKECAACHRDDMSGSPPQIPSLVDVGRRKPQGGAHADRAPGRRADGGPAGAVARGGRRDCRLHQHRRESRRRSCRRDERRAAVPLHRLQALPRPGWLSGDRAAVGNADRHRPEHRRARLADPASASTPSWPRRA